MSTMKCLACGGTVSENTKFCTHCGALIADDRNTPDSRAGLSEEEY